MAHYEILLQETIMQLCAKGRRHLQQVCCWERPGAFVAAPVGRLLQMRAAGDTFTLVDERDITNKPAAELEPCDCGSGYLLKPEGIVPEFPAR